MWCDHPFSQRNMTTERAVGEWVRGGREVGVVGGVVDKIWKKGGLGNKGGLHKITGLAPLCQLCKGL